MASLNKCIDISLTKERCFNVKVKRTDLNRSHSALVLIGLFSTITQRIENFNNPPRNTKAALEWLTTLYDVINPTSATDIQAMCKQQMGWVIDFLDEIKPFDRSNLKLNKS